MKEKKPKYHPNKRIFCGNFVIIMLNSYIAKKLNAIQAGPKTKYY